MNHKSGLKIFKMYLFQRKESTIVITMHFVELNLL